MMAQVRQAQSLLGNYRVLDLANERGVFCGKLLAGLGADVVKVEKPSGDPMRSIGPFYQDIPHSERSLFWFAFNTGKRSITLDIEAEEGRQIFKQLSKEADFLLESFQPGYLDNLNLGYSALSQINPALIMVSITPFGQTGPYRDFKAYDLTCQAMGGLMYITGDPDRPPVHVWGWQSYIQACLHAALGATIALYHREAGGQGQHVDVAICESMMPMLASAVPYWEFSNIIQKRNSGQIRVGNRNVPIVYECIGGYMACVNLQWFDAIVEWMDEEGMAEDLKDPQWKRRVMYGAQPPLTQEENDHITTVLAAFLRKHTRQELYTQARRRKIGWHPVSTAEDLLKNEQLLSRDYFEAIEHPELGAKITYPGPFYRSKEMPRTRWARPPRIGEHNQEIYERELSLSSGELSRLKERGII